MCRLAVLAVSLEETVPVIDSPEPFPVEVIFFDFPLVTRVAESGFRFLLDLVWSTSGDSEDTFVLRVLVVPVVVTEGMFLSGVVRDDICSLEDSIKYFGDCLLLPVGRALQETLEELDLERVLAGLL